MMRQSTTLFMGIDRERPLMRNFGTWTHIRLGPISSYLQNKRRLVASGSLKLSIIQIVQLRDIRQGW